MTKNAQRLSQLISTFGPGAMIDLPTRSVVVGGLEQWDMKGNAFTTLAEPRFPTRGIAVGVSGTVLELAIPWRRRSPES